jgi:uncharacterized protein YkwD
MTALRASIMSLRRQRAFGACVLFTVVATLTTTTDAQNPQPPRPDLSLVAPRVIDQTNALRSSNGLAPVVDEPRLARAAQSFAEFIASTDLYGHTADGRNPGDRALTASYEYCVVAENLGYVFDSAGFTTEILASRLVDGWKKSALHRKNMLLAAATEIGVGVAESARTRRYYAVQLLGRPRNAAMRFEVVNRTGTAVNYKIHDEAFNLAARVTRTHAWCTDGTLRLIGNDATDDDGLTLRNGARYVVTRDASGQARLHIE